MWKTVWVNGWLDLPHHLMSVTGLIDTAQQKYTIVFSQLFIQDTCKSCYEIIREIYIVFFFQIWDFPQLNHCFVEVVKYLRCHVISSHLCWDWDICWKFYLWIFCLSYYIIMIFNMYFLSCKFTLILIYIIVVKCWWNFSSKYNASLCLVYIEYWIQHMNDKL